LVMVSIVKRKGKSVFEKARASASRKRATSIARSVGEGAIVARGGTLLNRQEKRRKGQEEKEVKSVQSPWEIVVET